MLKRRARALMLVLSLGFMGLAGWELSQRWDGRGLVVDWRLFSLALVPLPLACVAQAYGWLLLMEHLTQRRLPRVDAAAVYLESQLARYTPGKVGLLVVRMAGAEKLGVLPRSVASSVLLEMMSWVGVGLVVGVAGLLSVSSERLPGSVRQLASFGLPLAVLGLLALVVLDRAHLPAPLKRWLGVEGAGPLLPITLPLVHVCYWAFWGGHGWFLVCALGGDAQRALSAAGYFVLAPVAGFLALAAPAGVGVREAALSLGLTPVLGVGPALAASVASRIASLLADFCTWALVRLRGRSHA